MVGYRLSFMMFLQFFIWGGWFVTLGTFLANNLSASGAQVGMAFSTQSWGAIIAPFVIGLIGRFQRISIGLEDADLGHLLESAASTIPGP